MNGGAQQKRWTRTAHPPRQSGVGGLRRQFRITQRSWSFNAERSGLSVRRQRLCAASDAPNERPGLPVEDKRKHQRIVVHRGLALDAHR